MGLQHSTNVLSAGRSSMSVITAALLSFCVVVLIFAFRFIRSVSSSQRFIAENNCKPAPAWPQRDPFFALDFILEGFRNFRQKTYLDAWRQYYADLGPTFTIRMRGVLYINTVDPENIKTVLAARFHDYSLSERVEVMGPLLGRGIFVTDGEEWAHSRALLRPNFAKDHVADLSMIDRHFGDLMVLLRPHAAAGSAVDLQPLLMRLTLDTATEFLFNRSTRTLSLEHAGPAEHAFGDAFQLSLNEMALLLRLGPFRFLHRQSREVTAAHKLCRAYVDRFVDEAWALKQGDKTDDRTYFLKALVESTSDKEKVRDELLNILIAGRDTVASLLGSLFRVLSRRPDIWAKVRAEVAQFQGKLPRYEQLRNLKYAKYCINEGESRQHHHLLHCLVNLALPESMATLHFWLTSASLSANTMKALRLWPAVPLNSRLAVRDTVLPRGGGPNGDEPVYVPKGGLVNYSVYAMHRRTDLFGADAEDFRPERWEGQIYSWVGLDRESASQPLPWKESGD